MTPFGLSLTLVDLLYSCSCSRSLAGFLLAYGRLHIVRWRSRCLIPSFGSKLLMCYWGWTLFLGLCSVFFFPVPSLLRRVWTSVAPLHFCSQPALGWIYPWWRVVFNVFFWGKDLDGDWTQIMGSLLSLELVMPSLS